MRRRSDPVDAGLWIEALRRIGDAVKVRVSPALKWSREVAAPVVIGSVKPVILLPIALASRLSAVQVEAVLAHELAHLRRGDTWALAVQRVVETILFFHPAVWWMSGRMEAAREEACDDLVLAAGCDPADYAEALVICSECRLEQKGALTKLAPQLAATGNGKERFRRRVLRLVGGGDGGAIRLGWAGWVLGLLLVGGAALAVAAGSMQRADLADIDFDNPPGGYEKGIKAADRNQRFTVDALRFQAMPLQWGKEGWLRLPTDEQGPGEELFLNPFKDRHKFFFNGLKVPTKVPADINGFGVAVADAVVRVIKAQNLPFLGNQRLQDVHAEFVALVQAHCRDDLGDGRKRAILAAIRDNGAKHLFLNRYRPGDLGLLHQAAQPAALCAQSPCRRGAEGSIHG